MISYAYAQDAAQAAPSGGMSNILLMVVIFGIFYFILIRPQSKKQKELEKRRNSLSKGDKIVTGGGVVGKVSGIKEDEGIIIVEIAKDVKVEIIKTTIMNVLSDKKEKK